MYYAQLDNENRVVSVIETNSELDNGFNIPIQEIDQSLLGMKYNAVTGGFEPPA